MRPPISKLRRVSAEEARPDGRLIPRQRRVSAEEAHPPPKSQQIFPRNPHPGAALTQKPRLTCMDEIQNSHVSAERKDDGVNKVSSTSHRNLFESFLLFLLSMPV